VVVDDRLVRGDLVEKPARGFGIEQEIFVDIRHGERTPEQRWTIGKVLSTDQKPN
jgi:hypothetical protein